MGFERSLLLFFFAVTIFSMFSSQTDAAENPAPSEQKVAQLQKETGPADARPGEPSLRSADVGFYTLMAGALAAGTTAAVYGSLTLKRNRDFELSEYLDATARDDAVRFKYITNAFLGVTVALLSAALIVKLVDIRSRKTRRKNASFPIELEWAKCIGVQGRF